MARPATTLGGISVSWVSLVLGLARVPRSWRQSDSRPARRNMRSGTTGSAGWCGCPIQGPYSCGGLKVKLMSASGCAGRRGVRLPVCSARRLLVGDRHRGRDPRHQLIEIESGRPRVRCEVVRPRRPCRPATASGSLAADRVPALALIELIALWTAGSRAEEPAGRHEGHSSSRLNCSCWMVPRRYQIDPVRSE